MLRISSSVSSEERGGPSTLCKTPCNRITGGIPTRKCKSEEPSATTNCNRSDIEYDIRHAAYPNRQQMNIAILIHITDRGADDFVGGGQSRHHFARPVLAQGAHAHLAGPGAQDRGRNLLVDQFPCFVIDHENLKNP